ncbi:hypothetical protein HAN_1g41 (nucleomorph) [Hemiselmis andersenii]|uniref:Uncharacterized protein n=1 Tax=Hemiselmis andersenii TaxID=464988 RepID=A9BK53_HEMAN|nr:hypothetical protein HAN_1g41 [Hemiselmis andersenii]ABW97886.1 hypothetical protein HAN_1g41 [Hemiselmis andersenii]|mmetsp:Transcript_36735/g.89292  ORF Transcript_36735/g.89292 Transcript_36735/m.89292 type:complete len:89 (+) Transcript_36735:20-286(+)
MKEVKKVSPNVFSLSKIKMIIQSNEKIGKISYFIPPMTSKLLEIFLIDILSELIIFFKRRKENKIKKKHFKYLIKKFQRFKKIKKIVI